MRVKQEVHRAELIQETLVIPVSLEEAPRDRLDEFSPESVAVSDVAVVRLQDDRLVKLVHHASQAFLGNRQLPKLIMQFCFEVNENHCRNVLHEDVDYRQVYHWAHLVIPHEDVQILVLYFILVVGGYETIA